MKGLVIGGSGHLGKVLVDEFHFDSWSRSQGYNVPNDLDKIVNLSFDYDLIINCLPDINQNISLEKLYVEHSKKNLNTYFITLGSMSYRINDSNHTKNQLLTFSESILLEKTSVKHTLINLTWCFNHQDSCSMTTISKQDLISVFKFLLENKDKNAIISMIEVKGTNVL